MALSEWTGRWRALDSPANLHLGSGRSCIGEIFSRKARWPQGERDWGRPVDVLVMPDGSLLVSDDMADSIYRITYKK